MMPRDEPSATSKTKRPSRKSRDPSSTTDDSAALSPNAAVESGSNSNDEGKIVSEKLSTSTALQAPTLVNAIKVGRKNKPSTKPPPPTEERGKEDEKAPKKPKRKRAKKDRAQPKRPLSAYNIFFKEERVNLLEGRPSANIPAGQQGDEGIIAHGKLGFEKLAKVIGHRWQNLPSDRLEYYQKLASEDSERYRREMDVYVANKKEKKQATMAAEQLLQDTQDSQESRTKGHKKLRSAEGAILDLSPASARATLSERRIPLSPSAPPMLSASLPPSSHGAASLSQQQSGQARALGAFGYQLPRDAASIGALGGNQAAPGGVGPDQLALTRSALGLQLPNLSSLLGLSGVPPPVDALGLGAASRLGLGAGVGGLGSQVPPAAMQLYLEQLMVERDARLLRPGLLGNTAATSLQSDAMRTQQLLSSLLQQQQAQAAQLQLMQQRQNEGQEDQDDSQNEDTGT